MSRWLTLRLALPFLACVSLAATPGSAQKSPQSPGIDRPIVVNCAEGGSIQRALLMFPQRTEQIQIEVHGFCEEAVDISRSVVIRGTDPATDGITGPASIGNRTGLVVVFGVTGFGLPGEEMVRLENLTVKDSPNLGVTVNLAQVGLTDVVIRDNNYGLLAFTGGHVTANSITVSGNRNAGILVSGGNLRCNGCTVSGNGVVNVNAPEVGVSSGQLFLNGTTVNGRNGLRASNGSDLFVTGGSVTAVQWALNIQSAGRAFLQNDAQLNGGVFCGARGLLDSRRGQGTTGLNQVSTTGGNQITNGCFLLAGPGTTTFVGPTTVSVGSYVATEGGNQAIVTFAQLGCTTGGKVTTAGGSIVVNSVPGIPAVCGV